MRSPSVGVAQNTAVGLVNRQRRAALSRAQVAVRHCSVELVEVLEEGAVRQREANLPEALEVQEVHGLPAPGQGTSRVEAQAVRCELLGRRA